MTRKLFPFAALVVAGSLCLAVADEPLPPPRLKTFYSLDKSVCAVSNPTLKVTTVYRVDPQGKRTKLWAMMGWYRNLYVWDQDHLALGYWGSNLLHRSHKKNEPMVHFVKRGLVQRIVTLDKLVPDPTRLPKTVSHYAWGQFKGFNKKGNFVIETHDGKVHAFTYQGVRR